MAEPALSLIPVLLGLGGLWVGTALTLRGALRMSGRTASWEVVVGLTVLGIGTALPEVGIGLGGAVGGQDTAGISGLIVGTALGSVLARATLVLGIAALIGAAAPEPASHPSHPPVVLAAIVLVGLLSLDGYLGAIDGGILVVAWIAYNTLRVRSAVEPTRGTERVHGLVPDAFLVALGISLVAVAAWWVVVPSAMTLSAGWGADPLLVGLLVLGVGASLPELVFAVSAATRGRAGLSSTSVLSSGMVGVLLPLGLAATIMPLDITADTLRLDLPALALAILGLWGWGRRRGKLTPPFAAFLVVYFMTYALIRMMST
jgi:cation:H+ antiporter